MDCALLKSSAGDLLRLDSHSLGYEWIEIMNLLSLV